MTALGRSSDRRRRRRSIAALCIAGFTLAVFVWDRLSTRDHETKHQMMCDEENIVNPEKNSREKLPLTIRISKYEYATATGYLTVLLNDPRFSSIFQKNPWVGREEAEAILIVRGEAPYIEISLAENGSCAPGTHLTTRLVDATDNDKFCVVALEKLPPQMYTFQTPQSPERLNQVYNDYPGIIEAASYQIENPAGEVIEARRDYNFWASGISLIYRFLPGSPFDGVRCPGVKDISGSFSLYAQPK
jgi:hypothetical protein